MIKSKLPHTPTSIFAVMSQLANEQNAINLSQGFPGFDCDRELISLVDRNMAMGKNQYAPMPGIIELREIISQKTQELYGKYYNPDTEITITSGATQALYTAITSVINEDDEVIVFEPVYDSYIPAITLNGGTPIFLQLKGENYKIDWKEVEKSITPRTKMIIINSPHNPTGSLLSEADLKHLEKIVKGSNIIILSDEVYEHIVFDNENHESVVKYPTLAERSFVVSSFGKTFHTTGWKMGYCIAPKELMTEFRKVHQFIVYAVNTPIQYALAEYLQRKEKYLQLGKFYQEKRDFFVNQVKDSRFKIIKSEGTYFQLLDYSAISDMNDVEFSRQLTIENKIASIPVSVFYHDNIDKKVLRFCFAKDNDILEQAATKLRSL